MSLVRLPSSRTSQKSLRSQSWVSWPTLDLTVPSRPAQRFVSLDISYPLFSSNLKIRLEWSLPARTPLTQTISTLGSATLLSFSKSLPKKSSAGKTFPSTKRSTSSSNPSGVSSSYPTPVALYLSAVWLNLNSKLTSPLSLVLGVRSIIPETLTVFLLKLNIGRPQRDGPALRATTLTLYANWLIANGNTTWVTQNLWPVLKLDLDYVQNNWNRSTCVSTHDLHSTYRCPPVSTCGRRSTLLPSSPLPFNTGR